LRIFEADYGADQRDDEEQPQRRGRLLIDEDADNGSAGDANPGPHRIGRAEGDFLQRLFEEKEA